MMSKNKHLFVPSQPKIRERTADQPSCRFDSGSVVLWR
jgi:hypothetical protein